MFPNSTKKKKNLSVSLHIQVAAGLYCASAVHHDMKDRLFSGQCGRKHTEHIFTLDGLYRTLCDRNNKSSPGTPEAFFLFSAGFIPLPKSPVRLFFFSVGDSTGARKRCELLPSPPATRGDRKK